MTQQFRNNARSRLIGALNNSATSFTIDGATADLFPVGNTPNWLAKANWFKATIENSLGQIEVVHVGVRTLGSGVFANVLRGQEGTTAIAFDAGAVVGLRITAQDIQAALSGEFDEIEVDGAAVFGGPTAFSGRIDHNGVPSRTVPVGGVIMFSGTIASIPAGWQLCDGTNGTPDLRDKFVIGAREDQSAETRTNVTGSLTKTGGTKDAAVVSHSHSASAGNQSADHSHSGTTGTNGDHSHTAGGAYTQVGLGYNTGGGAAQVTTVGTSTGGAHSHSFATGGASANHNHAITVNSTGESGTNLNLPPYYALAFIQCMPYAP